METPRFDESVDRVLQEVDEMLDAGQVGLYEFLEVLRGDFPELSEQDCLAIAKAAWARIEGRDRLVWLVWPSFDPVPGPATAGEQREHWETPRGGVPYPAIERID